MTAEINTIMGTFDKLTFQAKSEEDIVNAFLDYINTRKSGLEKIFMDLDILDDIFIENFNDIAEHEPELLNSMKNAFKNISLIISEDESNPIIKNALKFPLKKLKEEMLNFEEIIQDFDLAINILPKSPKVKKIFKQISLAIG